MWILTIFDALQILHTKGKEKKRKSWREKNRKDIQVSLCNMYLRFRVDDFADSFPDFPNVNNSRSSHHAGCLIVASVCAFERRNSNCQTPGRR